MDSLLDTHTLLWFVNDAPQLPFGVRDAIINPGNAVSVSIASFWEIGIKSGLGKLPLPGSITSLEGIVQAQNIEIIPITVPTIHQMMQMPMHHKDPFDRLIAATALTFGLTLLSADTAFDRYGVPRVWGQPSGQHA